MRLKIAQKRAEELVLDEDWIRSATRTWEAASICSFFPDGRLDAIENLRGNLTEEDADIGRTIFRFDGATGKHAERQHVLIVKLRSMKEEDGAGLHSMTFGSRSIGLGHDLSSAKVRASFFLDAREASYLDLEREFSLSELRAAFKPLEEAAKPTKQNKSEQDDP